MTATRTTLLAVFLGLTALPVLADGIVIDLPRLEYPTSPAVTRASTNPVTVAGTGS